MRSSKKNKNLNHLDYVINRWRQFVIDRYIIFKLLLNARLLFPFFTVYFATELSHRVLCYIIRGGSQILTAQHLIAQKWGERSSRNTEPGKYTVQQCLGHDSSSQPSAGMELMSGVWVLSA